MSTHHDFPVYVPDIFQVLSESFQVYVWNTTHILSESFGNKATMMPGLGPAELE